MENAIAIDGIELADSRAPSDLMRRDHSRARAAKKIEHDTAAARNVFDRIGDHRDRLDSRMQHTPSSRPVFSVFTPRYSQTFVR
jgi:hypothetical protein